MIAKRLNLLVLFLSLSFVMGGLSVWGQSRAEAIYAVAWSPDGTKVATGYGDGTIRIRDAADDRLLWEMSGHTDTVYSLAWASDNTRLVSGSVDSSVRIWNTSNGHMLRAIANAGHYVFAVAWINHDTRIVSGSSDPDYGPTLQKWNPATGERLQGLNAGSVIRIAPNTSGDSFVTINPSGTVSRWDAQSLQPRGSFGISEDDTDYSALNNFNAAAITDDGSHIATGSIDGTIRVWDSLTGQVVLILDANEAQTPDWTTSAVQDLHFDSTATRLYAISSNGALRGWDLSTRHVIEDAQIAGSIYAAAWSPDGTQIAFGGDDGQLHIAAAPAVISATEMSANLYVPYLLHHLMLTLRR